MKKSQKFNFQLSNWLEARIQNLEDHKRSSLLKYRILLALVLTFDCLAIVFGILACIWLFHEIPFYNSMETSKAHTFGKYAWLSIVGVVVLFILFVVQGISIIYKSKMALHVYEEGKNEILIEYVKYKNKIGVYEIPRDERRVVFDTKLDEIMADVHKRVSRRKRKQIFMRLNVGKKGRVK